MVGKLELVLLGTLLAASYALAAYQNYGYENNVGNYAQDYYHQPNYKYEYGVNDHHTGDQKHASEHRDAHGVKGQYSLREPDGSWRTVTYVADKGGFRANVHRSPSQHGGGGGGGQFF